MALNGENTQALVLPAENSAPTDEVAELTPLRLPGTRFAMGDGQGPPIGAPGLYGGGGGNPAIIAGIVGGTAAAFVIGTLIAVHHRTNKESDFVLFDAGWQFQMVLDSPVTLDVAQVAASAQLNP